MSDQNHGHDDESLERQHALRAEALEGLLVERGLISAEGIDAIVARYEHEIGPLNGAKLVARAWVDPEFRARLLADPWAAANQLGLPIDGRGIPVAVVENSASTHNVVVCTLCSCYPSALLGLPPRWYKSPAYRSRMVREPRALLAELGLSLPAEVHVRVWDSSSEIRYMVLPERPAGSAALSEAELAALVSRDALIGVAQATLPTAKP